MAQYELKLPKMGESVAEATIIKWVKQPGDSIDMDESVLEIATDKVDSEVPSPMAGKLIKQLFSENDVVQVGDIVALIETEVGTSANTDFLDTTIEPVKEEQEAQEIAETKSVIPSSNHTKYHNSSRFYSPLVKNIAAGEGVSSSELDQIQGTGIEGRVTKQDLLNFIAQRSSGLKVEEEPSIVLSNTNSKRMMESAPKLSQTKPVVAAFTSGGDEIIEMDRMRKLIADHMVMSKHTSPHVTSFVEADVTNIVKWRDRVKTIFEQREGEKITFTPVFIEAVSKAIRDFPMINVMVNGTQIIKKRDINIGMATALPSGNLIVPVIKSADQLSLIGLTKSVNDLAKRARQSKLKPDETQGGTFTLTNVGSFGNVMGTPIINQPQVAILAVGAIKKKPAVIETEYGDVIAIRHMMFLSLSYDHRVVDGSLGGSFIRKVADYLEAWDVNREI